MLDDEVLSFTSSNAVHQATSFLHTVHAVMHKPHSGGHSSFEQRSANNKRQPKGAAA